MRRDHPEAQPPRAAPHLPGPPHLVVRTLEPLLTKERIARIDGVLARRTRSVIPVLDGVMDPHNIAAVMRTADAFGVQEVHLIDGPEPFIASQRVAQGTDRWLDLVRHRHATECVASLRSRGFKVYVATMHGELAPDDLGAVPKVAVVFGNEHSGVTPATAALCDGSYRVPMCGFAQSLNVSVAAAITLYGATRARDGDLDAGDRERLRARFMMLSVPRAEAVVRSQLGL